MVEAREVPHGVHGAACGSERVVMDIDQIRQEESSDGYDRWTSWQAKATAAVRNWLAEVIMSIGLSREPVEVDIESRLSDGILVASEIFKHDSQ